MGYKDAHITAFVNQNECDALVQRVRFPNRARFHKLCFAHQGPASSVCTEASSHPEILMNEINVQVVIDALDVEASYMVIEQTVAGLIEVYTTYATSEAQLWSDAGNLFAMEVFNFPLNAWNSRLQELFDFESKMAVCRGWSWAAGSIRYFNPGAGVSRATQRPQAGRWFTSEDLSES